jgi:hypothetical protein
MKAIKKLVVLGALATLCGNAAAVNLVRAGVSSKGTKTFYVDTDSVLLHGTDRTSWDITKHIDGSYVITITAFRCTKPRQVQILEFMEYSSGGTLKDSGRVPYREDKWGYAPPESIAESLADIVCSTNGKRGENLKEGKYYE